MANGMGSLYIGSSGLRTSQNALNTTANNLANVDTTGYVRQQVIQADRHYNTFDKNAAISNQQSGLGVSIADVIHSRDIFLDKSYRTETGRQSFYSACYSATNEIYTYFQELEGEAFQDSISSLYTAFEEFSKDPSDSVNQNLVMQKSSLFISRAKAVYTSLQNYQNNLNTKISKDIDRINELGKKIYDLNENIVKIEAGGVETAMELRDQRDNALDELAGLVHIDYDEKYDGTVFVSIEGVDFVNRAQVYEMGKSVDDETGYITPYWPQMQIQPGHIHPLPSDPDALRSLHQLMLHQTEDILLLHLLRWLQFSPDNSYHMQYNLRRIMVLHLHRQYHLHTLLLHQYRWYHACP